jgi:hypothetical protein
MARAEFRLRLKPVLEVPPRRSPGRFPDLVGPLRDLVTTGLNLGLSFIFHIRRCIHETSAFCERIKLDCSSVSPRSVG